ncbi:MAG: hypothetical protein AAB864_02575 [Patescibacteria group bacterium]
METMTSAERLRIGQANIDRMKREVDEAVSTVLGVVCEDPNFFPYSRQVDWAGVPLREQRVFKNAEFQWTIYYSIKPTRAECWYKFSIGSRPAVALVYVTNDSRFPKLEHVALAHRARVFLVDSMLAHSTRIAEELKPILDAADHQF